MALEESMKGLCVYFMVGAKGVMVWKLTDVAPSHIDLRGSIDMTETAQTEAFCAQWGRGETVNSQLWFWGMKDVAHAIIQLIVENGAPILDGGRRPHVWRRGGGGGGGVGGDSKLGSATTTDTAHVDGCCGFNFIVAIFIVFVQEAAPSP